MTNFFQKLKRDKKISEVPEEKELEMEKPEEEIVDEPIVTVVVQKEDVKSLDKNLGVKFEDEIKKVITEVTSNKNAQVNIQSLSRAQFRVLQRMGKLPK